jgi:ammonia channel protein AmtB
MQGNSGIYRVMGGLILFFSFFSFNASSVAIWQRVPLAGLIASNTAISGAFGCFSVMIWKLAVRNFQVHIMHCIDGLLAGCVAMTAGAHTLW